MTRKTTLRLDQESASHGLRTAFAQIGERRFAGFAVDPSDLQRRFTIEVAVDGFVAQVIRADDYVHELARAATGDGCYGFSVTLDARLLVTGAVVVARLANVGTAVGEAVVVAQAGQSTSDFDGPGAIRWLGSLRFSGWIADDQDPTSINVMVDGLLIDQLRATGWTHLGSADDVRAVRAFDLYLPSRFGDGSVHQVAALTTTGEHLRGSPLSFLTFVDGLRDFVSGNSRLGLDIGRAELLDQLVPAAVPFTRYPQWQQRFPIICAPTSQRAAVVLVGSNDPDQTWQSLQAQTDAQWVVGAMPPGAGPVSFAPDAVASFLNDDGQDCDFVVFTFAGTVLAPNALARLGSAFETFANTPAVYGDFDIRGADGTLWPLALSAFDYERLLEQGYSAHIFALRREVTMRLIAAGASDLYRLFNAVLDEAGERKVARADIVHLPGSLGTLPAFDRASAAKTLAAASTSHLQRCGVAARAMPGAGHVFPAVRLVRSVERQSVSIIIPTRNRRELLEACIESLSPALQRQKTEIVVVDNDSTDADALKYLSKLEAKSAKVLQVPGPFNFARINNMAARAASNAILCLLNNDVQATGGEWLDEMLGRMGEADVGAVGALLIWPTGVVQHGGVVLGANFAAHHAFNDRIEADPGYADLLRVAHECSAVTAACLLTPRRDYLAVGGMDEIRFPVNFNDVDYCLKLRARGQRVIFTPHARLFHQESASRGPDLPADRKARFEGELRNLRAKWGDVLASDPYYSPLLSRDAIPFSALAWPPGPMSARTNSPPVPVDVPSGF